MRRQPNTDYHTDRGTGTVAARTMRRSDGHVEVIIETGFLADVDDTGQGRFTPTGMPRLSHRGLQALRRTMVHEAQHAVMIGVESGYEQYELQTHAVISLIGTMPCQRRCATSTAPNGTPCS